MRGLVRASLGEIKDSTFVGISGLPQPDGSQRALEIHIFPESMRGTGEGHLPRLPGRYSGSPLSDLTMSYFSVDGLVSGIKSHMIEAPSKATAAILRNVVVWPKLAAIRPKTAVLSAAPIPDAVPMMP